MAQGLIVQGEDKDRPSDGIECRHRTQHLDDCRRHRGIMREERAQCFACEDARQRDAEAPEERGPHRKPKGRIGPTHTSSASVVASDALGGQRDRHLGQEGQPENTRYGAIGCDIRSMICGCGADEENDGACHEGDPDEGQAEWKAERYDLSPSRQPAVLPERPKGQKVATRARKTITRVRPKVCAPTVPRAEPATPSPRRTITK